MRTIPWSLAALLLCASARSAGLEALLGELSRQARETPGPAGAPLSRPPRECPGGLDFGGVTWPAELTAHDRAALGVGLNMAGSFEGPDGWSNISDNFDGQGLSLGLLNQNLGQGSLQPLLLRVRDERPGVLAAIFSPQHLQSLLGMLAAWKKSAELDSGQAPFSPLDVESEGVPTVASAADSVKWAKANLYRGGAFDPAWKRELVALAAHPVYVSVQIAAALAIHAKAAAYHGEIGVGELRAYLMLFDVVVQNGGLYPQDLSDYAAYVAANPRSDATARLEKLVALRVRHVRARYAEDVRSRKLAIVRGVGKVHGQNRNLPGEYCYDGDWAYPAP